MAGMSPSLFPSPDTLNPVVLPDGSLHEGTVFLKAAVNHPRFEIGAYSYASSFDPPVDWAARLAPHLHTFAPEKIFIGKFCQIAHGATFITASANHRYDGFSTFPFAIFGEGAVEGRPSMPAPGPDTIVGHDVWIGQGATLLPGVNVGNGAIIGAGAVVGGTVPDYAIVTGNPASVHRMRFAAPIIKRLNALQWWDWPIETIMAHEQEIVGTDLDALERSAPNR